MSVGYNRDGIPYILTFLSCLQFFQRLFFFYNIYFHIFNVVWFKGLGKISQHKIHIKIVRCLVGEIKKIIPT
uniref:Putative ovule protein n=1 Tax=Solanum chacoense TaxID=4108 RepID=A0A0V0IL03_SOLCH